MINKVLAVEDGSAKLLLALKMWQKSLRCETRGDNQLLGKQLNISASLDISYRQDPAAIFLMLSRLDLVLEPDLVKDVKVLGILGEILMDHVAGDVLAWQNPKRLRVHGKVRVLVGSEHVVALETGIETLLRPSATNCSI